MSTIEKDTKNMGKTTTNLMNELKRRSCLLDDYFSKNDSSLINVDISDFWHKLVKKSGYTKSDIINRSDFGYVYFYDVINGKKNPSRDKIVRLIISMHLSFEDCQDALKYCGRAQLYPRIRRDSILIFSLLQGMTIYETDELLIKNGEAQLK